MLNTENLEDHLIRSVREKTFLFN